MMVYGILTVALAYWIKFLLDSRDARRKSLPAPGMTTPLVEDHQAELEQLRALVKRYALGDKATTEIKQLRLDLNETIASIKRWLATIDANAFVSLRLEYDDMHAKDHVYSFGLMTQNCTLAEAIAAVNLELQRVSKLNDYNLIQAKLTLVTKPAIRPFTTERVLVPTIKFLNPVDEGYFWAAVEVAAEYPNPEKSQEARKQQLAQVASRLEALQ